MRMSWNDELKKKKGTYIYFEYILCLLARNPNRLESKWAGMGMINENRNKLFT